jgi:YidC/Oxa1 family membrane protein insertase
MFPLNLMQAKSTKGMALLAPTQKRLQQQYKNDQQILNREMSALYRKYKVNPLSGCLPLVIQLPILIALYNALRELQYVGEGISFFWLPNMSDPDPIHIMPVITAISSFLQQKLMMDSQPVPETDQQKMTNQVMLYGMPIMMGWMTWNFASGLALYWSVSNIIGFVMQIAINSIVNRSQADIRDAILADEAREKAAKEEQSRRQAQREETKRKNADKKKENVSKPAGRSADRRKNQRFQARSSKADDDKGKELDFDDFS